MNVTLLEPKEIRTSRPSMPTKSSAGSDTCVDTVGKPNFSFKYAVEILISSHKTEQLGPASHCGDSPDQAADAVGQDL